MIHNLQPTQWINTVSALSNYNGKICINLEGKVSLLTDLTPGWREFRIEEIVKTSLKVLKKNIEQFKEQDLEIWRKVFTHFNRKIPASSTENRLPQMEELLNWLNRLLENREKTVVCLKSLQNGNAQRKAIEQAASELALNDDTSKLILAYQQSSEQLNRTLTIPKTWMQIQNFERRLRELTSSFNSLELAFIKALDEERIDCSGIGKILLIDKELQTMQQQIIFFKSILLQWSFSKQTLANDTDHLFSKSEKLLTSTSDALNSLLIHNKIFMKIVDYFQKLTKFEGFLQSTYLEGFLYNFAITYNDFSYKNSFLTLQSKSGFVLASLEIIERLACLMDKVEKLREDSPTLPGFENLNISLNNIAKTQNSKLNEVLSSIDISIANPEINNEIEKVNTSVTTLQKMKNFISKDCLDDNRISLNEMIKLVNQLNSQLDSECQIEFDFEMLKPTQKQNTIFQNLIKDEISINLSSFNANIIALKKELSTLYLPLELLLHDSNLADSVEYQLKKLQQNWQEGNEMPDVLIQRTRALRDKLQQRYQFSTKMVDLITKVRGENLSISPKYISRIQLYCSQFLKNEIAEGKFEIEMKTICQEQLIEEIQKKMQDLNFAVWSFNVGHNFGTQVQTIVQLIQSLKASHFVQEEAMQAFERTLQNSLALCKCLEDIKETYSKNLPYIKSRKTELEVIILNYLNQKIDSSDFKYLFLKELQQQSSDLLLSTKQKVDLANLRTEFQKFIKVDVTKSNLKTMRNQFKKWSLTQHPDLIGSSAGTHNFVTASNFLDSIEKILGILPTEFEF